MSRFKVTVPADYVLHRDACSYGYFLLAPNHWLPIEREFHRVLDLADGPARLAMAQPGKRGTPLAVRADRALSRSERGEARRLLTRMLRLDEGPEQIHAFHKLDPRSKPSGRGRLLRSPSFFEDVIKTVTSCNVTWPSTVSMNRKLCEAFGRGGAFPQASVLAAARPAQLRARCSVGYRDARIVELAGMFVSGEIEPEWFEDAATSDAAIRERLLDLPGIGPYAANNIMQLLGRYGHLPLDTESVRHGRSVLGWRGSAKAISKRLERHFAPFGEHKFRSYWFELWDYYEAKRGKAHTWDRETTGKSFTAAMFKE